MEQRHENGQHGDLEGARILLIEDDTFILMDLEAVLTDAGAEIVGPCSTVAEAMVFAKENGIDAAILDFGLHGETAAPIARSLTERQVPFFFYTGQVDTDPRLSEWRGCKVVEKPAQPRMIVAAVAQLLHREA